ncbi:hypothetical protein V6M85_04665 [Sulfolobus tengchongensis]|uniref:Uncharacterized protein n=1 Tax=Sulfolobus tengchongensis TaxID=207809 RepID=A0AAX4L420_9CREN
MSTEIDSKNVTTDLFTINEEEELKVGEALAHILAAASIVIRLEGESEDIKNTIMKYVDLWVSKVSPLDYSPGMAEVIGSKLKRKITDVFDEIDEDELGEILDFVVNTKKKLNDKVVEVDILELEVKVERILRVLGIDVSDIKQFFDFIDIEKRANRLISLLTVAVGIASIWDGRWIAESQ